MFQSIISSCTQFKNNEIYIFLTPNLWNWVCILNPQDILFWKSHISSLQEPCVTSGCSTAHSSLNFYLGNCVKCSELPVSTCDVSDTHFFPLSRCLAIPQSCLDSFAKIFHFNLTFPSVGKDGSSTAARNSTIGSKAIARK